MCGDAVGVCDVVFFFKQKTAYEMRISDWSSDVCSSDLRWPSMAPAYLHPLMRIRSGFWTWLSTVLSPPSPVTKHRRAVMLSSDATYPKHQLPPTAAVYLEGFIEERKHNDLDTDTFEAQRAFSLYSGARQRVTAGRTNGRE